MKIINVMAASLDGKIGAAHLESDGKRRQYGFTNRDDQEFVRDQIKQTDAIITGANSMRASGGAWDQVGKGGRYPLWVVVSNQGLEPSLKFWQQSHIPRCIASKEPVAIHDATVQNVTYGSQLPGHSIASYLRSQAFETVLLFGGGFINRIFYEEKLVDMLKLTLCPLLIGSDAAPALLNPPLPAPVSFRLVSSQPIGSHVFLSYEVINS